MSNAIPMIELSGVSQFHLKNGREKLILDNVNLKVRSGEFVAIIGFSGAGKSTLISLLAGLVRADIGGAIYRGKEVSRPGPERSVVFQACSLMPWLSVSGNIAFAVDQVARTSSRWERRERVEHYIELLGLLHVRDRKPAELSDHMRQRVALARALAVKPAVLLLDEPLARLDAQTRACLQDELSRILHEEKKTTILMTDDVDEALLLADRVIALTPAPAATLGREFVVNLPHPRERSVMNHDEACIASRSEIIRHLQASNTSLSRTQHSKLTVPDVISINRDRSLSTTVAETSPSTVQSPYLELAKLSKLYPTPQGGELAVVRDFELNMDKGEFVTLIGHSGCGKSTILEMAAGLSPISTGSVMLDGTPVSMAGSGRVVVFQSPSQMPWLTAIDNVILGVSQIYPTVAERRDVAEYYLIRAGLADSMHRTTGDLSNSMQLRIGIARTFAMSPDLLLLDEPFAKLDNFTRWELQDVLMDIWTSSPVTTVCVTGDIDEAILLADRVVMMSNAPEACIDNIMNVDLPRPRSRAAFMAHRDHYAYREELLAFLRAGTHYGSCGSQPGIDTIRR